MDISIEGPLSKWTNVVIGWQYRWFVLDEGAGVLWYYTVCIARHLDRKKGRGYLPSEVLLYFFFFRVVIKLCQVERFLVTGWRAGSAECVGDQEWGSVAKRDLPNPNPLCLTLSLILT